MCIFWTAMLAVAVWYIMAGMNNHADVVLISIVILSSAVVQLVGAIAFFGGYTKLAGFNTMTADQMELYLRQHDVEKVSYFIGVSFSLISCLTFFVFIIAKELTGLTAGIIVWIFALLSLVIAASFYVGVSKRFGAEDKNE